jgi:hypothetical protein
VYRDFDRLVLPETRIQLLEKEPATGGKTRRTFAAFPKGSHAFVRRTTRCPKTMNDLRLPAPGLFAAPGAWEPVVL